MKGPRLSRVGVEGELEWEVDVCSGGFVGKLNGFDCGEKVWFGVGVAWVW